MRQSLSVIVMFALLAGGAAAQPAGGEGPWQTYDTSGGEWRSYAGSIGGQKYSPLDQIDASNFADLEIAWEWLSVDRRVSRSTAAGGEWSAPLDTIVDTLVADTPDLYRTGHRPLPSRLQATPLMVDGVLYFNTPLSQGVAVDATTGETRWVFNPKAYEEGTPTMSNPWSQRGVAYWTDGAGTSGSSGAPATAIWSASPRGRAGPVPTSARTAAARSTRWSACRGRPARSATTSTPCSSGSTRRRSSSATG